MSFNFPSINQGTLIYSVNGVQVLKTIERLAFANEDFSANFVGVTDQKGTGLGCNSADSFDGASATVNITQSGSAMTLVIGGRGDTCTFPGTYSQKGHFGRVIGSYVCTSGASGTFDFFEMVRNAFHFRMRTKLTPGANCTITGHMVGLAPGAN